MPIEDQSKPNAGLVSKRVVVLGGSSGIGLAVAQQVVANGGKVVIASSNPDRIKKAVATLGDGAEGHALDLGDEAAIEQLFQHLGHFDHLIYTAGESLALNELAATDLRQTRRALDLRFWGALAAVKHGSPHIRKGGSIVLTTGIAGERPQKGWVIAASICGAIVSLTRALAVELAPIRVNAVSPGIVRTNLWGNMAERDREQMYESAGKTLLVGRVGEPCDIARTYLFLMQEGFATGQTITVDGGAILV